MENFINFFVEKGSEIVYTERRGLWSGMAPFSGCLKDTGFLDLQKGETCGGTGLWMLCWMNRGLRFAWEPGCGGDSGFAGEQNLQRDGLLGRAGWRRHAGKNTQE